MYIKELIEEKVINGIAKIRICIYMSIVYNSYIVTNCTEMTINQYTDVVLIIYNAIINSVILFRNMKS